MLRRTIIAAGLAALAATAGGCMPAIVATAGLAAPTTTTIRAEYTIGATPIVIIPFRDAGKTYYESSDGLDLAMVVAGELQERKAATVRRPDEPVRTQFAGQDIEKVGWAEVAKAAGAQLVLIGDIQEFRLRDPKTQGLLRGYTRVGVRIFDVRTNCVAYASPAIETWVPDYGVGVPESDVSNLAAFRNALVSSTAMKIAQKFYTWERKIGPEPRRY